MAQEKPDTGRAWLIAVAACIINMILSGISRMIGILFVAVLEVYGVSRQEATMPFSVRNSIRSIAGPLVGVVGLHFKVRNITFCGGIVAALGACLCAIAPSIKWLTICWGIIHGLGFAFANTLFQVVVNQYFEKYRATASGIALSGACVGSLVFPFLFEFIMEKYGLSGAFLILGGMVMNVLPPSLLLVSPPWLQNSDKFPESRSEDETQKTNGTTLDVQEQEDAKIIEELRTSRIMQSSSFSNCPTETLHVATVKKSASFTSNKSTLTPKRPHRLCEGKISEWSPPPPPSQRIIGVTTHQLHTTPEENEKESNNGSSIFDSEFAAATFDPTNQDTNKKENPEKTNSTIMMSVMSIVRLYRNPAFVLISICMVAYIIIFIPILAVIVDYGIDKGLPEADGKYLISSMAFGDLIGRLGFGWVTDRGYMTISNFMMMSLLLQGVVVIMLPMAHSFYTLTGLLALYGVTAGSVLVLFPILVLKHVSLDDQPVAMGCAGFLSGMVTFGIPPFIGYFRDGIGSYDGMFYITAAISIFSGILWLLEPLVTKCRLKQLQRDALNR